MKKLASLLFVLSLSLICGGYSFSQECFGVKIKEGGGFEMANFDGKGKPAGNLKYKFTNVKEEGGFAVIDVELESVSTKGKSEYTQKFTMKCNGNESFIDAASLMMEDQLKSFEDFKMTFKSSDIVYPNQLNVGQTLRDASLSGTGDMSGLPVIFEMNITNRKVEAKEKISVGAGDFEAYKITSSNKMSTKTIANISFELETISYRAPGVIWDLKTETYRKGKLIGRSELTKIY